MGYFVFTEVARPPTANLKFQCFDALEMNKVRSDDGGILPAKVKSLTEPDSHVEAGTFLETFKLLG